MDRGHVPDLGHGSVLTAGWAPGEPVPRRFIGGIKYDRDEVIPLISSEQDCQLERVGTADQSRDPCHRRMTVVWVPGRPQTSVSTASNVESLVKRPVKVASLN